LHPFAVAGVVTVADVTVAADVPAIAGVPSVAGPCCCWLIAVAVYTVFDGVSASLLWLAFLRLWQF
jgi:hypothetical protein